MNLYCKAYTRLRSRCGDGFSCFLNSITVDQMYEAMIECFELKEMMLEINPKLTPSSVLEESSNGVTVLYSHRAIAYDADYIKERFLKKLKK